MGVFDAIGGPLQALGIEPSGLPLVGGAFESPEAKALQAQFRKLMETYQQYREPLAEGRMNALGNQLSIFGPVNSQLAHMYGQGAQFDTNALLQNPMPPGMTQIGAPPPKTKAQTAVAGSPLYRGFR